MPFLLADHHIKYAIEASKSRCIEAKSGLWKNRCQIKKKIGTNMIDSDGFRPNVGIVLSDGGGKVFWARRSGKDSWQFPQGGIKKSETPEQAMYRELEEETGLASSDVEIMGCTRNWLRYRLPSRYIRKHQSPVCIGQKQIWYMLRLVGDESHVRLDHTEKPEFDSWEWVDYWLPMRKVIFFKRDVYRGALEELAPLLFPDGNEPSA